MVASHTQDSKSNNNIKKNIENIMTVKKRVIEKGDDQSVLQIENSKTSQSAESITQGLDTGCQKINGFPRHRRNILTIKNLNLVNRDPRHA